MIMIMKAFLLTLLALVHGSQPEATPVQNAKVAAPVENEINAIADKVFKDLTPKFMAPAQDKKVVAPVQKEKVATAMHKENVVAPVLEKKVVASAQNEKVPVHTKSAAEQIEAMAAALPKDKVDVPVQKKKMGAPVQKKKVAAPVLGKKMPAAVQKEKVAVVMQKAVPVQKDKVDPPVRKERVVAPSQKEKVHVAVHEVVELQVTPLHKAHKVVAPVQKDVAPASAQKEKVAAPVQKHKVPVPEHTISAAEQVEEIAAAMPKEKVYTPVQEQKVDAPVQKKKVTAPVHKDKVDRAIQKVVALQVTPVQKVVALLQGMLEKGKKDKYDEQTQFASFKEFCEDVLAVKEHAIDDETANIEHFTVDIRKERVTAVVMKHDIARLDQDISNYKADIKAATNVRALEKADYGALFEDYSESVNAIMEAIETLKKQTPDRKQQTGLVQMSALTNLTSLRLVPAAAKKAIDTFVQQSEEDRLESLSESAASAPESNAYEFQSAGVIDVLKKLLNKFVDERRVIDTEEGNSQKAYDRLVKSLAAQIETAIQRRGDKASGRSKQLEMKADNKGERVDEFSLKDSDVHYSKDLRATCAVKTSAFNSRQRLRATEIVALEKAIQIISSGDLAGNAKKHLPAMLQTKGSAFVSLRSSSKGWNRVATYLQEQALKLNSHILAQIAVTAAKDPFIKVKKMLSDLLVHLMEEATEEANHKGWCDTELTANGQTRKEKAASVDTMRAEIDQIQAAILKHTDEIHELNVAVAELDAGMAAQTKLRIEEKAKNMETIADAGKAQTAVEQALGVLREFYADAGDGTEFVQKDPELDDSYKGMGDESIGVLGMLEVIETDFARLETATKAAEATGLQQYDKFMLDSNNDKAAKMAGISHKNTKKLDETGALNSKKKDLDGTQQELDAALVYFEKLRPSCVDSGLDYEDRVFRRKEEIEALRGALRVLNGEDLP